MVVTILEFLLSIFVSHKIDNRKLYLLCLLRNIQAIPWEPILLILLILWAPPESTQKWQTNENSLQIVNDNLCLKHMLSVLSLENLQKEVIILTHKQNTLNHFLLVLKLWKKKFFLRSGSFESYLARLGGYDFRYSTRDICFKTICFKNNQ